MIDMFRQFEIETCSMCNRKCPTCIRNSTPNKELTSSWFKQNLLPLEDIGRVFAQVNSMGFRNHVCLSHYNEPLLDDRITDIAHLARHHFSYVMFCSNADFLTESLAKALDGNVDLIGFTLYMDDLTKRSSWIQSLFKKTTLKISHGNDRMITHFSPIADVVKLSQNYKNNVCLLPRKRMIVNHKGEMLLCCDDLTGNFKLGTIYERSVKELWYSEEHQRYVNELAVSVGRKCHPHCMSCPRP
jgi:radical SAM protein with 4Fe4S-binding SPASM domain